MSRAHAAPVAPLAEARGDRIPLSSTQSTGTTAPGAGAQLRLWLRTPRFAEVWPSEGLLLHRLPFVVGRLPDASEHAPRNHVDLRLPDTPPYRMSRVHFCVMTLDGGLAVMDTNSHFGTIVNGFTIGRGRPRNHALLEAGSNRIVIGTRDDRFEFDLLVT